MRMTRSRVIGATLLAFALIATACGDSGDDAVTEGPEIVIGSFGFGESEILGEIYKQALEADGYTVSHNAQIGPREIVGPALESGEIGLVPEYVGSALEVTFGEEPTSDGGATRQSLADAYVARDITVLDLAPAQDKNTFIVTKEFADQEGLTTVSDLAKLGTVELGGPPECPERPRCQLGLETVYGLTIDFTALDAGGPLTIAALKGGEIQVGLAFSTFVFDPDLVQLEDDEGLQPAENIVPVVRTELVDAYGDAFVERINEVSSEITTEELTELNRQFGEEQRDAADIASDWLSEKGLV
jgi:osmoprotectant transport system substrate-binding protein